MQTLAANSPEGHQEGGGVIRGNIKNVRLTPPSEEINLKGRRLQETLIYTAAARKGGSGGGERVKNTQRGLFQPGKYRKRRGVGWIGGPSSMSQ